jgi:hypothetical protein
VATSNKDFRIKNGLIIEGSTATLNNENLATEDYVDNALSGATGDFVALTDVGEPGGVASLDENGQVPLNQLGNAPSEGGGGTADDATIFKAQLFFGGSN